MIRLRLSSATDADLRGRAVVYSTIYVLNYTSLPVAWWPHDVPIDGDYY